MTTTGNALEWGGFEGIEDDVPLFCEDSYTYDDTYGQDNADDLVLLFKHPMMVALHSTLLEPLSAMEYNC